MTGRSPPASSPSATSIADNEQAAAEIAIQVLRQEPRVIEFIHQSRNANLPNPAKIEAEESHRIGPWHRWIRKAPSSFIFHTDQP